MKTRRAKRPVDHCKDKKKHEESETKEETGGKITSRILYTQPMYTRKTRVPKQWKTDSSPGKRHTRGA
jgi:hypothetical protein